MFKKKQKKDQRVLLVDEEDKPHGEQQSSGPNEVNQKDNGQTSRG